MNKPLQALIVDDERLSRAELRSMLEEYESVKVVAEAEDVPSAMEAVKQWSPDLIFLDIQMPGDTGFALLEKMKISAKVIFVTAYDEYALRAFEVNAVDYLLKPVNPDRLRAAIEKIETDKDTVDTSAKPLQYDDRLFLTVNTHTKFLRVDSLISITSAGDYTQILTTDGIKGLTQKSMSEWEQRLPVNYFCRIHRTAIVNLEYIEKIEEWFNNAYRVFLKGIKDPYIMSRRYASRIKDRMS